MSSHVLIWYHSFFFIIRTVHCHRRQCRPAQSIQRKVLFGASNQKSLVYLRTSQAPLKKVIKSSEIVDLDYVKAAKDLQHPDVSFNDTIRVIKYLCSISFDDDYHLSSKVKQKFVLALERKEDIFRDRY